MDEDQVIAGYFMISFILLFSIGGAFCNACCFNGEDKTPLINDK